MEPGGKARWRQALLEDVDQRTAGLVLLCPLPNEWGPTGGLAPRYQRQQDNERRGRLRLAASGCEMKPGTREREVPCSCKMEASMPGPATPGGIKKKHPTNPSLEMTVPEFA